MQPAGKLIFKFVVENIVKTNNFVGTMFYDACITINWIKNRKQRIASLSN